MLCIVVEHVRALLHQVLQEARLRQYMLLESRVGVELIADLWQVLTNLRVSQDGDWFDAILLEIDSRV